MSAIFKYILKQESDNQMAILFKSPQQTPDDVTGYHSSTVRASKDFFFNEENETYLRQISLLKQAKKIQKGMQAKEAIFKIKQAAANLKQQCTSVCAFPLQRAWCLRCSICNFLSY